MSKTDRFLLVCLLTVIFGVALTSLVQGFYLKQRVEALERLRG